MLENTLPAISKLHATAVHFALIRLIASEFFDADNSKGIHKNFKEQPIMEQLQHSSSAEQQKEKLEDAHESAHLCQVK